MGGYFGTYDHMTERIPLVRLARAKLFHPLQEKGLARQLSARLFGRDRGAGGNSLER